MNYSIRQMTRYLMLAITSVVAFHAMPLEARAQAEPEYPGLRLYDSFSAPHIDPLRWYTFYSCGGKTTSECNRQIENGSLHLRARAYGDRTSNAGTEYGPAELALVTQNLRKLGSRSFDAMRSASTWFSIPLRYSIN